MVSGPDFGQLRPVLLGVIQQPHDDRAAGRFRDGGHVPHHAARGWPGRLGSRARSGLRRCDLPRSCYAAAWRGAGHAERRRTQDPEETRPGGEDGRRDRLRAQIVLAAARGHPDARIAAGLGISADTVRKWRGRFAARGLDGLTDRPRPGRPRQISAADRAAVVALACQLPAATGVPLGRQSGPELAAELTAGGWPAISPSSVLRILAEHPERLRQPRTALRHPAGLRGSLQPDRQALQLEIHRQRPARPHEPHQPPRTARRPSRPAATAGRMTPPDELPGPTT